MDIKSKSILKFYTVSPMHAGAGDSTATVDVPIQRERHTNYPLVHASGIKGAMREHYRNNVTDNEADINMVFGSDTQDGASKDDHKPGAFSVSDAKLFAFPMRSSIPPFVQVTCPAILKRFVQDSNFCGKKAAVKDEYLKLSAENAVMLTHVENDNYAVNSEVILEDAVVKLGKVVKDDKSLMEIFKEIDRLLIISDEMFDYCVTCTEIQTNIKIDTKTGTAADGALRYQEFLPSDTVLYSVVFYNTLNGAQTVKEHIEKTISSYLQIGGDYTLGKGICKIEWIAGGAE